MKRVGSLGALLSDVEMPTMRGPELHAKLTARGLDLATRTLFMTGGAFGNDSLGNDSLGNDSLGNDSRGLAVPVVTKPFDLNELREQLTRAARRGHTT